MWKKISLNVRFLLVFALTVSILTAAHTVVYVHLLGGMKEEITRVNTLQFSGVASRLDDTLEDISGVHEFLTKNTTFQRLSQSGQPDGYDFAELNRKVNELVLSRSFIRGWFMFFANSNGTISDGGYYLQEDVTSLRYQAEGFSAQFWEQQLRDEFSRRFYPETEFRVLNANALQTPVRLVPLALKSYWRSNLMTVFFLDVESLCRDLDPYLQQGFYLFDGEGRLIFTSDETPLAENLAELQRLGEEENFGYLFQEDSHRQNLVYVKHLPETTVTNQMKTIAWSNLVLLGVTLLAVVLAGLVSLWRLLKPINAVFRLIQGHTNSSGSPQTVYRQMEEILKKQEQQALHLAQKDRELSEYCLRLQLKNLYVNRSIAFREGEVACLLSIRIHYREDMSRLCALPLTHLERQIQDLLEMTLSRLFGSSVMFQLDPGRFIAKVDFSESEESFNRKMETLVSQMDNEKDFAFFTIVRSRPVVNLEGLVDAYAQVLDSEQYVPVYSRTQLLELPVDTRALAPYVLSEPLKNKLQLLVTSGSLGEIDGCVTEILQINRDQGICRAHMQKLCIAMVNAAVYALAHDLNQINQFSMESNIYDELHNCTAFDDYRQVTASFIKSLCSRETRPEEDNSLLSQTYRYIENNYSREFSIEEMAEQLHVSRSYLSSYFKSKTESTLSEFIQTYRMTRAIELLKDPDNRIGDISLMVGIGNSNTFLRQFRKHTGLTPNEYRKKYF